MSMTRLHLIITAGSAAVRVNRGLNLMPRELVKYDIDIGPEG